MPINDRAPLIQVILASTREARFGEKPAAGAIDRLGERDDSRRS